MGDYVPRQELIDSAKHTLAILDAGKYENESGEEVFLADSIVRSKKGTVLYMPVMEKEMKAKASSLMNERGVVSTTIEVTGETSLEAILRLHEEGSEAITCLNFASARTPGGGFLRGANAQEESLARSSAIYPCISQMKMMYDHNRNHKSGMYSDYMIFSPDVAVIKDDQGKLLNKLVEVSFITSPAVNAGVIREREPGKMHRVKDVMMERIEKVLSVAVIHGTKTLILGAFGCGVFKNDPADVAEYFKEQLTGSGKYADAFERVVFAIYDPTPNKTIIHPFSIAFEDDENFGNN